MSLLEELKEQRAEAAEHVADLDLEIKASAAALAQDQKEHAEWVQKLADLDRAIAALSVPEVAEVEIPEGSAQQEKLSRLEDVRTAAKTLLANASGHYINAEDRYVLESALDMFEDSDVPEGYKPWPPQETLAHDAMIEYRWREGDFFRAAACQTIQWTEAPQFYRVLPIEPAAEAKGEGEDPAMNVPEGFMVWSPVEPLINPRPADGDIVRCWFGGEDYVGPLRGDEFDWNCEADPILAYEIIKTFAQVEQEKAAPDTIAITIAASQPHAEESALAQPLPPLFKPEPPQPATPEELEKMGVTDPGASAMARMLSTAQAGHVRKGWPL